ncbi:hypothetical protein A2U01_0101060, partial [Trifolium medium]|nr:hypothetical protein [Trifolium medium]
MLMQVFCHLRVAQGLMAHCAMMLKMFGDPSANCAPRRKDGASRQQGKRK